MSGVGIALLCEDSQTDSFVRQFLKHRNLRARDIATAPLPSGSQSGEQWVRQRFPKELQAIRRRRGSYLIVVTDADTHSIVKRRQQLDAECKRCNVSPRGNEDPVLIRRFAPEYRDMAGVSRRHRGGRDGALPTLEARAGLRGACEESAQDVSQSTETRRAGSAVSTGGLRGVPHAQT